MHDSSSAALPLAEPTYFILLSLSQGPKHGYAIMKDVRGLSDGRVALSTGTLYGAIRRLLDQGWIESDDNPADAADARGRRSYRLTVAGSRVLEAEVRRLERLLSVARLRGAEGQA